MISISSRPLSRHIAGTSARSISTTFPKRQRQPQNEASSSSSTVPPIPPTTTSTVTSNITADATPPSPSTSTSSSSSSSFHPPEPSTAEMQRRIQNSLSGGKPGLSSGPDFSTRLAQTLRQNAKSVTESYTIYGVTEAMFKSCAAQAPYTIPEEQRLGLYNTGAGPPKTANAEDLGIPDFSLATDQEASARTVTEDAEVPPATAASAATNSFWFNELGLLPTFSTWSQVTFLHMYLLTIKLRTLESHKSYLNYQRYLIEHFSNAAEDKMLILHGMSARGIRNRYLKDLFIQWRGVLYAYDQGLVQGDAVLATAVWRNLWKASYGGPPVDAKMVKELKDVTEWEDVDWAKVAMVVAYMRRVTAQLARVDSVEEVAALVMPRDSTVPLSELPFWANAREGLQGLVSAKSRGIGESV